MGLFDRKPAWMAKNFNNQDKENKMFHAIDNVIDQAQLVEIVKTAPHYEAYLYALSKITDQTILEDIAKNSTRNDILGAIVKKLTNQSLLADYAKNNPDKHIRSRAVDRLEDREALSDVAKNDKEISIIQMAIIKLSGAETLKDGLNKLTDCAILENYIKHEIVNILERQRAEARLFAITGIMKYDCPHTWVQFDKCLQKCSLCGALKYDHDYICIGYGDNGFVTSRNFQCKKCGEEANEIEGIYNAADPKYTGLVAVDFNAQKQLSSQSPEPKQDITKSTSVKGTAPETKPESFRYKHPGD